MALCRMIVCALWVLWMDRNKFIYEGVNQTGSQIASFVQAYLKELDDLKSAIPGRRICVDRWSAPIGSRLKVNFDAMFIFAAEEMSCLQALKLGLQLGWREIEVEGDSRRIIRKLTNMVPAGAVEAMTEDRRRMEVVGEVWGRRDEEVGESFLQF